MGRLIPQALYRREVAEMHRLRTQRVAGSFGSSGGEPASFEDYEGLWERVARRIDVLDPDGREAYAVLRQLQLSAGLVV